MKCLKLLLIKQIFVKIVMIRNTPNNSRLLSTSNDKPTFKKSTSTSAKNKSTFSGLVNSSNTSMTSSIKKSRIDTGNSKSNKKKTMTTSNSNKSLKELRETSNYMNKPYHPTTKKNSDLKQQGKNDKKNGGAIMIKNIKNKIVGNSSGGMTTNTKIIKGNKQNTHVMSKKGSTKIQTVQAEPETNSIKTPRTPRQKPSDTFVNKIGRREVEKQTVIVKKNLSIDMFELGRKLGKGRFGDVYMGRDIESGFAVAIKVINKKQLKESEMESQLIQQIKIQMYSNHPNILKMYGFFDDEKKIYLLLELATNGCLFRQIRQKTYFTEELSCYYFRQVISGIRYLHSNSVIHRDIKPENILNCFGVLKICDFGWAIYSPIYQRQTFCGTLDYVPPEIVTGQFYDEKADVWCLGVLCYELCTGKAPFESKTDQNETYDKILKVQIDFPLYLSGKVVDFVSRILNRDPQKRMNLEEVESHEWMRLHQNQTGRMISKQIWENWMRIAK